MENILKRKGYNVGAIRDVLFLPNENISDIPDIAYVDNKVDTSVIELTGIEFWLYLYYVAETANFSEDEDIKDGNIYYKQKLVVEVAQENLNRWVNFEEMEYHQFMMIIRDNNNISRFVGSMNKEGEKSGMILKKFYETKLLRTGRNGYALTFYRESGKRAPIAYNVIDLTVAIDPGYPINPDGWQNVLPPVD